MKTLVVLGMHRSGTSLLARALHTFENDPPVSMGDKMLDDVLKDLHGEAMKESNSQGHYEDFEFMQLNDAILNSAGGSWFNPPPREQIKAVGQRYDSVIKQLLDRRKDKTIWGWKDPRTCLTADVFHPYLENPHYICMFRDVEGVAKSLVKRDAKTIGMTFEYADKLAREYNKRILNFISDLEVY